MRVRLLLGLHNLYKAATLRILHTLLTRSNIGISNSSFYRHQLLPSILYKNLHLKMLTENEIDVTNPLLSSWNINEFGLPPFSKAEPSHFEPAITVSMKTHLDELKNIVNNIEPANFENTVAAFDRSGELFGRITSMFDNLCSSNGVPELQEVELKMAGPLATHHNQVSTFPGLFQRIDSVYQCRTTSNLNAEQIRLVERIHLDFVRNGAKFSIHDQEEYAKITEEMAELCTKFTQVSHLIEVMILFDEFFLFLESSC